jgi:hypothetical protein
LKENLIGTFQFIDVQALQVKLQITNKSLTHAYNDKMYLTKSCYLVLPLYFWVQYLQHKQVPVWQWNVNIIIDNMGKLFQYEFESILYL